MGALNRKLHDLHCMTIMFYHTLTAATVMLIVILCNSIATGEMPEIYSTTLYCWICLSCVLDSISMNSMTFAFQSASPAFVSLIGQLSIVYAFIADALIFKQTPSTTELIGASIIIVVTMFVGLMKILNESSKQTPAAKKGFEVDCAQDDFYMYGREDLEKSMAPVSNNYDDYICQQSHYGHSVSASNSALDNQTSANVLTTSQSTDDDDDFEKGPEASSFTKVVSAAS